MSDYIKKICKYLREPGYRFSINARAGLYNRMSDETYIKKTFRKIVGYELDLNNVNTFTEKMQWIKLNDRQPIYTTMVDKFAAKQYVSNIIGEEHIIPNLGVWERFDDIDFLKLPDQFVLKTTHNSGGVMICRDKSNFNKSTVRKRINNNLSYNYYKIAREWPYKDVPPRIIAEKYMYDEKSDEILDYKFFCFNGEPKFLYVSKGLENHMTARISFLTLDWKYAPFERKDYKPFDSLPPPPNQLQKMIQISRILSTGKRFLRVDLYEINNNIYFSELTFTPCGGYIPFKTHDMDVQMGKLLNI